MSLATTTLVLTDEEREGLDEVIYQYLESLISKHLSDQLGVDRVCVSEYQVGFFNRSTQDVDTGEFFLEDFVSLSFHHEDLCTEDELCEDCEEVEECCGEVNCEHNDNG